MSYVDRYAAIFHEAADRQARPSTASRLRRHASRPAIVAVAAAAAVVAAATVLPGVRLGERGVTQPTPDPQVQSAAADALDDVLNGESSRRAPCRPPRPGAGVSFDPPSPAALEAFGVFRTGRPAPASVRRAVRRGGDPRAMIVSGSVRVLRAADGARAVLFLMRGPAGRFIARDPEACAALQRAELERRLDGEPGAVAELARERLAELVRKQSQALEDERERVYLHDITAPGISGGGGGTIEQVRRTGMGGTTHIRHRGRPARETAGLVPDRVHWVEVVARGGDRRWVRRHRVRVRDNYFHLGPFHAASFRVRWLDARGEEIARG